MAEQSGGVEGDLKVSVFHVASLGSGHMLEDVPMSYLRSMR